MKKAILLVTSIFLLCGFAKQPDAPRPAGDTFNSCLDQVDWDATHIKGLKNPFSVAWNDPKKLASDNAYYAYVWPENLKCREKFNIH